MNRKLDALVAEKIFNHQILKNISRPNVDILTWWDGVTEHFVPQYSSDIAAAWPVFRSHHLTGQVISYLPQDPKTSPELTDRSAGGWALQWSCTSDGEPVYAPTAPLAICLAALRSAGVPEAEIQEALDE